MNTDKYEAVITGLEVHAHLSTRSKMFCGCSTARSARRPCPSENVCPRCMGMPGVLPGAQSAGGARGQLAVRAGLAAHCEIARESIFDRKSYFYPDLPKGYQISQYLRRRSVRAATSRSRSRAKAETKRIHLTRSPSSKKTPAENMHEADGSRWSTLIVRVCRWSRDRQRTRTCAPLRMRAHICERSTRSSAMRRFLDAQHGRKR